MRHVLTALAVSTALLASCASSTDSTHTGSDSTTAAAATNTTTPAAAAPMAKIDNTVDPVCEMKITAAEASATTVHEGKTLGFCSEGCADEFKKSPAQYVAKIK